MARSYFDDATIDITCPKCSKKTDKSIRWIKSNRHINCPACGSRFELERSQFDREIGKADRAIADFERTVKRAFN